MWSWLELGMDDCTLFLAQWMTPGPTALMHIWYVLYIKDQSMCRHITLLSFTLTPELCNLIPATKREFFAYKSEPNELPLAMNIIKL